MDTLTHIVLGGCTGELLAGKRLGKKAIFIGAFANSIPDLDFIAGSWLQLHEELLAHRGFTHSFLFLALAALLMALLFRRWFKKDNMHLNHWLLFFGVEILLHLMLDAFNTYGTAWFEPFSHKRISFNSIFVADPLFTIWLVIAFVALLLLKNSNTKRKKWAVLGLVISTTYLVYCISNKYMIDKAVKRELAHQNISYNKYFTTPTPLNNLLWFVAAGNDTGFYVGHMSVFDKEKTLRLQYFPKNDNLLSGIKDETEINNLKRFAQGFYTVEKWNDTLVFNDLRFGQIIGWHDEKEKFVFHYFIQRPEANDLVVQRGRFAKWTWEVTKTLWRRMWGKL
jgi:inner membrane protein